MFLLLFPTILAISIYKIPTSVYSTVYNVGHIGYNIGHIAFRIVDKIALSKDSLIQNMLKTEAGYYDRKLFGNRSEYDYDNTIDEDQYIVGEHDESV